MQPPLELHKFIFVHEAVVVSSWFFCLVRVSSVVSEEQFSVCDPVLHFKRLYSFLYILSALLFFNYLKLLMEADFCILKKCINIFCFCGIQTKQNAIMFTCQSNSSFIRVYFNAWNLCCDVTLSSPWQPGNYRNWDVTQSVTSMTDIVRRKFYNIKKC